MKLYTRIFAGSFAALLACATNASPVGQLDTPAGGAFANACAGRGGQMQGAGYAGQAAVPELNFVCNSAVAPSGVHVTSPQSASGGGVFNGLNYSNKASAAALRGAMHFATSIDSNLTFTSSAGLAYAHVVAAVPVPVSLGFALFGFGALSTVGRRRSR